MSAALSAEARLAYAASLRPFPGDTRPRVASAGPRRQAFDAFLERGWPTTKQEEWRFTE